jgi:hypothetical protein
MTTAWSPPPFFFPQYLHYPLSIISFLYLRSFSSAALSFFPNLSSYLRLPTSLSILPSFPVAVPTTHYCLSLYFCSYLSLHFSFLFFLNLSLNFLLFPLSILLLPTSFLFFSFLLFFYLLLFPLRLSPSLNFAHIPSSSHTLFTFLSYPSLSPFLLPLLTL